MRLQGAIFHGQHDGESLRFEEAFPQIAAVEVEIDEAGPGNEGLGRRCLVRRSIREFINCSNPACQGKGLALGAILRRMLREGVSELGLDQACASRLESGDPCPNGFRLQIRLVRRPAA